MCHLAKLSFVSNSYNKLLYFINYEIKLKSRHFIWCCLTFGGQALFRLPLYKYDGLLFGTGSLFAITIQKPVQVASAQDRLCCVDYKMRTKKRTYPQANNCL